ASGPCRVAGDATGRDPRTAHAARPELTLVERPGAVDVVPLQRVLQPVRHRARLAELRRAAIVDNRVHAPTLLLLMAEAERVPELVRGDQRHEVARAAGRELYPALP